MVDVGSIAPTTADSPTAARGWYRDKVRTDPPRTSATTPVIANAGTSQDRRLFSGSVTLAVGGPAAPTQPQRARRDPARRDRGHHRWWRGLSRNRRRSSHQQRG